MATHNTALIINVGCFTSDNAALIMAENNTSNFTQTNTGEFVVVEQDFVCHVKYPQDFIPGVCFKIPDIYVFCNSLNFYCFV